MVKFCTMTPVFCSGRLHRTRRAVSFASSELRGPRLPYHARSGRRTGKGPRHVMRASGVHLVDGGNVPHHDDAMSADTPHDNGIGLDVPVIQREGWLDVRHYVQTAKLKTKVGLDVKEYLALCEQKLAEERLNEKASPHQSLHIQPRPS